MDEDWHELVSQARSAMKLEKEVSSQRKRGCKVELL